MSGAFGWGGANKPGANDTQASPGYFDQQSRGPSVVVQQVGGTQHKPRSTYQPSVAAIPAVNKLPIPNGRTGLQKTTAEIVLIIALDVTGSMSAWPKEILQRLARLYTEACAYFETDDIDVLFMAHGDARTDEHPIQIAKFGRGQELESILSSFYERCGGGGQATESQELLAVYLSDQVDLSSAKMVYTFFVTDEAACSRIDPILAQRELGMDVSSRELDTVKVFRGLLRKMRTYTVLCHTQSYSSTEAEEIKRFWESALGTERILPLDDARRVVDVMLGVFAKTTGQMQRFSVYLQQTQGKAPHGTQNINTIMKSIALVGGVPQPPKILPKTATKPLLGFGGGNDDKT